MSFDKKLEVCKKFFEDIIPNDPLIAAKLLLQHFEHEKFMLIEVSKAGDGD